MEYVELVHWRNLTLKERFCLADLMQLHLLPVHMLILDRSIAWILEKIGPVHMMQYTLGFYLDQHFLDAKCGILAHPNFHS
jgi:hypothetical protein